jgi:transglutaminase-like putative cysteine protease
MSWRMHVVHTTVHSYAGEVVSSYNEARMVPLTLPSQICLDARVHVEPPAALTTYSDYWGTLVNSFDIHHPHRALTVQSRSLVESHAPSPPPEGVSWNDMLSGSVRDQFGELLEFTHYAPRLDDKHATEGLRRATPRETAHTVMEWVGDQLHYEPGVTDVTTTGLQALRRGRGVCQDFAHLGLAALRGLGIPARYVSGYLHPSSHGHIDVPIDAQGHAWVEWWDGGWMGWDVTHRITTGQRHVIVARGRDYADVVPLKGVYHGAPPAAHQVEVVITRKC